MQIQITGRGGANVRSGPSLGSAIIDLYDFGEIVDADQAAVADWWALTEIEGYIHHSVASLYVPPQPLPEGIIPYHSQEDVDARRRNNDCGPACVDMLLASKGIAVRIDDIPEPDPSGLSSAADLVRNLQKYGLGAQVMKIAENALPPRGAICLIWYGAFNRDDVLARNYSGLHWVVFLWEDHNAEDVVVVHDPDYYGTARNWGAYHRYPKADWERAFTQNDVPRLAVVLT